MSMDLFEKVLTRQRTPAPVQQRLPKAVGTLKFATWLGWAGAGLALVSGLFPVELGLVDSGEQRLDALLQSLPLAAVFAGVAFYMRRSILERFLRAAAMFPSAEAQRLRMRWTPSKAVLQKVVELRPLEADDTPDDMEDDTEHDAEHDSEEREGSPASTEDAPLARAVVEKNLRRFDLSQWEAEVSVYLDPEDPERVVLIDDGRFLYAGNILARDEHAPSVLRRNATLLVVLLCVGFFVALEAWHESWLASVPGF